MMSLKKRAKLEALGQCRDSADGAPDLAFTPESVRGGSLPHGDGSAASVTALDVLEHVEQDDRLLREWHRVLRPGGRLRLSVPRVEPHLGLNRLRRALGMRAEVYGHVREGYSIAGLAGKLEGAAFDVAAVRPFCGAFTELIELLLNRVYLTLSGNCISPLREEGSTRSRMAAAAYSLAYPFLRPVTWLDRIAFPHQRYGVVIEAVKRRGR